MIILLIIIYLAFISLGLPDSLFGSAWPSMYPVFGVDISLAGIISMLIAGSTVVSSLLSDKFIKKFGTIAVTSVSVLTTAVALLLISLTKSFYILALLSIPLGLGAGAVDAALNNFVANHYKAIHMNWLHAFWGVGTILGPIVISIILTSTGSFRGGYLIISMFQFLLSGILIASIPLWKKANHKEDEIALNQNNKMKFFKALKLPKAKWILIAFFCYCSLEWTVTLWGTSFLVIVKNIKEETAALWISLYFLGITLGRILSGLFSTKLKAKTLINTGFVLIVLGISILFLPIQAEFMLIGLLLIGLGCAPIFPTLIHETPNNFGKENSQKLMGMQMASAYIGITFMPPLFGLLAKYLTYTFMPVFLMIMTLIMIVSMLISYKIKPKLNDELAQ